MPGDPGRVHWMAGRRAGMSGKPGELMSATSSASSPALVGATTEPLRLHDELARYCLPQASYDPNRRFAWAISVCSLFLVIAIVGLKGPLLIIRPPPEVVDVLPVVFVPPPQEDQPPPDPSPDNEEPPPEVSPLDAPMVATVVAADTSQVAFAVPVEGPVILAAAKYASAPPAQPPKVTRPPPSITVFRPGRDAKGTFPKPPYVNGTLRPGEHAEVTLYVEVETDGIPSKVEVFKSCGNADLDRSTLRHVKNRWRWNPGERRTHYVPIEFQIQ